MSRPRLILASGSPRRKELLASFGLEFEVIVSHVDEEDVVARAAPDHPEEMVMLLAEAKAREVARSVEDDALVIGADTIVWLDNSALNKPKDEADAVRMLMALSGRVHRVYTGIAITPAGSCSLKPSVTEFDVSEVEFHTFDTRTALKYVRTGEPMDKAGAYGIQEEGAKLVKAVRGDYYNVVGLPLARLRELMLPYYPDLPRPPSPPMTGFEINPRGARLP